MNNYNNYKREQRFRVEYEKNGEKRVYIAKSEEYKNKAMETCERKGWKILKITKLYPFSTNKNQHNFELVKNRCFNIMHDMEVGNIPYNKEEYNRLAEIREKASDYFSLELPVAWLDWNTLKEVKEISQLAVEFRINTCIENNRLDLIRYC